MSYYLTAHRGNRKINMPIEEKHLYITDVPIQYGYSGGKNWVQGYAWYFKPADDLNAYILSTGESIATGVDSAVRGYNVHPDNIMLLYKPWKFKLVQGTGANQRIGDKVYLKHIKLMYDITINPDHYHEIIATGSLQKLNTATTTIPEFNVDVPDRQNNKFFMKIRFMLLRFDDMEKWFDEATAAGAQGENQQLEYIKGKIAQWFNYKCFVPTLYAPAATSGNEPVAFVSNQTKMLRESTDMTGRFKILKDEMITINALDPSRHLEFDFDIKKNLTFENIGNKMNEASDFDFRNVVGIFIMPSFYQEDMDLSTAYFIKNNNQLNNFILFNQNVKYTYYDI